MYSRIIETYLTVCIPELNISVRQYGSNGEKTSGFLARMTNDCLRFKPTVGITCYGMNDHEYRAYQDGIGLAYRTNSTAIVEAFKANHVRVIQGSPSPVGKHPTWVGDPNATVEDMNLNLCQLRNIGIEVAQQEEIGFADVFWPMLTIDHEAKQKYGPSYALTGKDGVHPGWAGHLVMAYVFLRALGLDGDIGSFTVDMKSNMATVSLGHELLSFNNGELQIESHRYPFCPGDGDPAKDDNVHSGTLLVPFDQDLNRLMLFVKHARAKSYQIVWGDQSKTFTARELAEGVNLSKEFLQNPFSEAFRRVDEAVAAKQAYETKQIREIFRSPGAKSDMAEVVSTTEEEREALVAAIRQAFVPVKHTIKLVAQ